MNLIEPRLTVTQARAAADTYGWEVMAQDAHGFMAVNGDWAINVVFGDDGAFRCASTRKGVGSPEVALLENSVIRQFAQHGRPVSSEETST
jgi:hypothetical protein